MKVVLGLGNPGLRYRETRHNLGFRVVDHLAERWSVSFRRPVDVGPSAWIADVVLGGKAALLCKPRTYMNRVGRTAAALREHRGVGPASLLVVYDDADLDLGRIRIRPSGGAGGHNGIRSLIAVLGTQAFARVRLGVRGVGRNAAALDEYVLEEFDAGERPTVDTMVERAADAVETVLLEGISEAMNRFNPGGPGLTEESN